MRAATHQLGGVTAWAGLCAVARPAAAVVIGGCLIAGVTAPLPDSDNLGTWARRRRKRKRRRGQFRVQVLPNRKAHPARWLLARFLTEFGTHRRGPCHSLTGGVMFAALWCLPAAWNPVWPLWTALAALTGWWSHLALDLANEDPVMLLWPWPRLFHGLPGWLRCRVGGPGEIRWDFLLLTAGVLAVFHA